MPQAFGATFAPTFENSELAMRESQANRASSPLKVLNYNLRPRVAGSPGGLSPLQGQGLAGSSISRAVLESVLRTILGADADMLLGIGQGSSGGGSQGRDEGMSALQGAFAGLVGRATDATTRASAPAPTIHPGGDYDRGRTGVSPDESYGGGNGRTEFTDRTGGRDGSGSTVDASTPRGPYSMPMPDFTSILRG